MDGAVTPLSLMLMEDDVYAGASQLVTAREADEIADAASYYVEEVTRLIPPFADVYLEQKIAHATIPDFGGTVDCLAVLDDELQIYDLKTGKWPAHFEQLACYALLARQEHPRPTVNATIIQLRAIDGGTVQRRTWGAIELDAFADRVREAAESEEVHAGDWCRFATCRATCKLGQEYGKKQGWPP